MAVFCGPDCIDACDFCIYFDLLSLFPHVTGRLPVPDKAKDMPEIDEDRFERYIDAISKMPDASTKRDIVKLKVRVMRLIRLSK